MLYKQICVWVVCMVFASSAFAQVFYKNNPSTSSAKGKKLQSEGAAVDCQASRSKGCQGTSKPKKIKAFGDCRVVSTSNGRGLFIPARSKKEWGNFMDWAKKHPEIVTLDSCSEPQWSGWTACSNTCGKGVSTRQCNRPPLKDGSVSCKGDSSQECSEFLSCTCGELEKAAVFCEGQDKDFSAFPPVVTYVDFSKCDHATKCQARCPMDHPATEDGTGCAP